MIDWNSIDWNSPAGKIILAVCSIIITGSIGWVFKKPLKKIYDYIAQKIPWVIRKKHLFEKGSIVSFNLSKSLYDNYGILFGIEMKDRLFPGEVLSGIYLGKNGKYFSVEFSYESRDSDQIGIKDKKKILKILKTDIYK
jgi:hypothetical protein